MKFAPTAYLRNISGTNKAFMNDDYFRLKKLLISRREYASRIESGSSLSFSTIIRFFQMVGCIINDAEDITC